MRIRFSDDVVIDTGGPIRIEKRLDGIYVVGDGLMVAVDSFDEGEKIIKEHEESKEKEVV